MITTRRIFSTPILLMLLMALPLRASAQTTVEYYHVDALGSVRAVTDQTGNVIRRHDYAPFGEEISPTALTLDRLRFTGKERDGETGLDYVGARYYASQIGRFTTVDPALNIEAASADPQRWNRYVYALNNSLQYVDQDGRDPQRARAVLLAVDSAATYFGPAAWAAAGALTAGYLVYENRQAIAQTGRDFGALITRSGEALANTFSQFAAASEPFAREWAKLGHLKGHLTPLDLEGARRDLAGDPVMGPGGRPFQHLKEVQDAQRGLQNLIEQLKSRIGSGTLSKEELEEAQRLLGEASRTLDRTEQLVPRR